MENDILEGGRATSRLIVALFIGALLIGAVFVFFGVQTGTAIVPSMIQ